MRIGTIGTSFITEYILENIAKTEGITCEAIYSRAKEKGQALANSYNANSKNIAQCAKEPKEGKNCCAT